MWTRRAFSALALAGAAGSTHAATPPRVRRRDEVRAWRLQAETTHPRGREAAADPGWWSLADGLEREADSLDLGTYVARMYRLAAWFRDGHTTFYFSQLHGGPFDLALPMAARAFYDGLYVTQAADEALPVLGGRIVAVNDTPVEAVMRAFADIWPSNNPAWAHHDAGLLFANAGLLHGLGVARGGDDQAIAIQVKGADGSVRSERLKPRAGAKPALAPVTREKSRIETWATTQSGGNWIHPLPEARAVYVAFDDLSVPIGDAMSFSHAVLAAAEEPTVERLILDLRRNGGGNNLLGEPLRHGLERSRLNHPGGLYVLAGPQTFSAAQNFCTRMERETATRFVGEPTGGAPNHYGDAGHFKGAATGLEGGISTLPWFDSNPQDKRVWLAPDIPAPRLWADWIAGRDTALDAALADQASGPANDFTQDRVFPWRRKSQDLEWKPFWR